MPYSITEPRPAKTHPPCEKRTWGKNRAREKFAYQIPSQALELQQEKPPTATKLVLGVCDYHFGHDLIAIDQRETALGDWEQHFYSYDGLGSVRALTDSAGQQSDTYTYDAFGIQLASTGTTPNAYRYTGEQFDEDLGQYYLRARYNDPNIGRFWSMDRFEGASSDPQTLHKYLYAHNNPVNGTDPSGRSWISTALANVAVRGILFGLAHPVITGVIGFAANAVIPEVVHQSLIGSGIPGASAALAVRRVEIGILRGIKNFFVRSQITKALNGKRSNLAGKTFETIIARAILQRGYREQISVGGGRSADFLWRGFVIEAKTSNRIAGREIDQLQRIASYARGSSLGFRYMFLNRPTASTIRKIRDAGGDAVWFFD